MQTSSKIILGVDPGTLVMGYSIIAVNGSVVNLIEMNALKLRAADDHYLRLKIIYEKITELINRFQPQDCAIEAPFFGKNVQSMLKLGRAQGVAIGVAMEKGLQVSEYSPRRIKQSITGNGNAAKEQVWKMLQQILKLEAGIPVSFDASDALAVAVCHHFQAKIPLSPLPRKSSGWAGFIAEHPDRVKKAG